LLAAHGCLLPSTVLTVSVPRATMVCTNVVTMLKRPFFRYAACSTMVMADHALMRRKALPTLSVIRNARITISQPRP
jgi:hypothetical protein